MAQESVVKFEHVSLEKHGDHVVAKGPYTKRELRKLLLSTISLPAITRRGQLEETLKETGLSQVDFQKLKDGKTEEISEMGKDRLDQLEVTEEMIVSALKTSATELVDEIQREKEDVKEEEKKVDPLDEMEKLLRSKGLSESLIKTLLQVGLTEEFIRLLKALGLTDEEIAELQRLWKIELKERDAGDSSKSSVSSSDEYLSKDGIYLKYSLSRPLADALREVVAKKPFDPVEYLAHRLLYYKICQERAAKRKEAELELLIERERLKMRDVEDDVSLSNVPGDEEESVDDWNYLNYEQL